ncbi:MAG: hypothetical protein ABI203_09280 [Mucilaginibacter sp.]
MKKNTRHIIYAWIVLFCFVAGQTMVYAHQHLNSSGSFSVHKASQTHPVVSEKCQLCDAMHHNSMLINDHQHFSPIVAHHHFYTPGQYNFVSVALILSAGRSPPIS